MPVITEGVRLKATKLLTKAIRTIISGWMAGQHSTDIEELTRPIRSWPYRGQPPVEQVMRYVSLAEAWVGKCENLKLAHAELYKCLMDMTVQLNKE